MTLNSPGVEIDIIDQSAYLAGAAGPIPLIIAPTAANKTNAAGTGVAKGTTAANVGALQLVTSKSDLTSLFGVPNFVTVGGAVQQGSELNEYGLLAAYSFLGVADAAYVMRPNIDLAQLKAAGTAPTGPVASNTYWMDLATTSWGLLEWNYAAQSYSVISPKLLNNATYIDPTTQFPLAGFGTAGDYAVVFGEVTGSTYSATNTIRMFYKGARPDRGPGNPLANNWVLVGSTDWVSSTPTVTTTAWVASQTINLSGHSVVNGAPVTNFGPVSVNTDTSVANFVTNLNTALGSNGVAFQVGATNSVQIYSNYDLVINVGSGPYTPATVLGLTTQVFGAPALQQSKHTIVPQFKSTTSNQNTYTVNPPRPTGSVWFKTTSPNNGANIVVNEFNASGQWVQQSVPLYPSNGVDNEAAIVGLSTDGMTASTIKAGSLYLQYDTAVNNTLEVVLYKWYGPGPISVTSSASITNSTSSPAYQSTFSVVIDGSTYTVTTAAAGIQAMAAALTSQIPSSTKMTMTANSVNNTVTITNTDGYDFTLIDGTNSPLSVCNITPALYSNFEELTSSVVPTAGDYTASVSQLTSTPLNGTLWYNSLTNEVDIMVNAMVNNVPTWVGYRTTHGYPSTNTNGPVVSVTAPTSPAVNDIWIDTSDLENYPMVNVYTASGTWRTVSNTDSTSENGIIFADARSTVDGTQNGSSAIADLLLSNYVDIDAPPADLYPTGMLLFNLRASGYNVKKYVTDYFNTTNFPGMSLPAFKDAWVSVSPINGATGLPNMGRKAQRAAVVQAMVSMLNSSLEAIKDQYTFNLIAAPGYPELASEMVSLNLTRKQTAFVLIDPPFRLEPTATALVNWATNVAGAADTGEAGLTIADDYAAVYYPNAYTTELNGNNVLVPASHIMLTTIALNDQIAYPWFAPAGLNRGVVSNATSVGYLNSNGNFQVALLGQGERDAMYEHKLNPIVVQPTTGGIVIEGQKTLDAATTLLGRVNVARLVVYIRNQLPGLVKQFLFEPNDAVTRNNALSVVNTFLNGLVAERALYDFLAVCDTSNNTPTTIDQNQLWIDIAIKPVTAVEFIYIPVRVENSSAKLTTSLANGTV